MTAGGFLCYTKDVFCLFVSVEIRRNAERHGASSIRRHSAEKAARQWTSCPCPGGFLITYQQLKISLARNLEQIYANSL